MDDVSASPAPDYGTTTVGTTAVAPTAVAPTAGTPTAGTPTASQSAVPQNAVQNAAAQNAAAPISAAQGAAVQGATAQGAAAQGAADATLESSETTAWLRAWQSRLLPLMVGTLTVLAVFFFFASCLQLFYLHSRIERTPELDLRPVLSVPQPQSENAADHLEYVQWKTLTILEGNALQRRYHQANVLLMSRVWITYLGFVTGMILAIVGAAFILGKLRESASTLSVDNTAWKVSLATASPGLFLAVLGTVLMLTTMVTHYKIEVVDNPLYLYHAAGEASGAEANLAPRPFPGRDDKIQDDGDETIDLKGEPQAPQTSAKTEKEAAAAAPETKN
jgi:hypothetical protein